MKQGTRKSQKERKTIYYVNLRYEKNVMKNYAKLAESTSTTVLKAEETLRHSPHIPGSGA